MGIAVGIGIFGPLCALAFVGLQGRRLRAAIGAAVWLGATLALASSGKLADFSLRPPLMMLLMIAVVVVGVASGFARLSPLATVAVLVGVQAFRLPLECVMHFAALQGVMPHEMSFGSGGYNYEIVTGALALPVALLAKHRAVVWAWLALAWATLLGIIVLAVISSPMVHAFGLEPEHLNTWVAQAPFVWLPAGPVVFALFGQVALTRKLLAERGVVVPA
jgi:hypothetical protein